MAGQAWNRKEELDRAVLEHVRAMLLVLAALVERAAGLPPVERLRFLAVLGCGEAEVRSLIIAMAYDAGSPTEVAAAPTAGADICSATPIYGTAALLAARFRMLALAVDAMLALVGAESSRRHASPSLPAGRKPRRTAQTTPLPALRATSPPARGTRAAASATMFFLRTGERRSGRYWRYRSRPTLLSPALAGQSHMDEEANIFSRRHPRACPEDLPRFVGSPETGHRWTLWSISNPMTTVDSRDKPENDDQGGMPIFKLPGSYAMALSGQGVPEDGRNKRLVPAWRFAKQAGEMAFPPRVYSVLQAPEGDTD